MLFRGLLYRGLLLGLLLLCSATAWAATEIEISAPGEQSVPLALVSFIPQRGPQAEQIAAELNEVLNADLDLAGMFRFVDPDSFLDDAKSIGLYSTQVDFAQWRLLGAETLIKGTYILDGDELTVEARLFDVVNRRLLTGRRYVGKPQDVRRMGHAFADLVLKELTGEAGPFSARIAYISDKSGENELWLMDVDGHRPLRLTDHRSIVLNPDFSPRGKEIIFTSYRDGNPDLYRKEIYTGTEAKVSYRNGLNTAGRFSPNNDRDLALTLSKDGNPEIYLMTTSGRIRKRVTNKWGIDSDPSWSPDGESIAFVSNRQGNPHVFVTKIFGDETTRITSGKYNATPAWSPKGDRIAFSRQQKGQFDIYTVNIDGTDERRLTFGPGNNEHPRWSPDGRFIIYSLDHGENRAIYVMRADGTGARKLTSLESDCRHPAWSPRW